MNVEKVVARYAKQYRTYCRFTEQIHRLLETILDLAQVKCEIESRTKELDSFRGKILGNSYDDPWTEITDLSGIRIIVHRLSDIPKVMEIVNKELAVDSEVSKNKGEKLSVDQFGYRSVHLIVGPNKNRCDLADWEPFQKMKAEIQVRTFLQHVWAMISHSLVYKTDADIPKELRRRLFRLSALFELSDEELDSLTQNVQEQIETYNDRISRGDAGIELNINSLRAFIDRNAEARQWIESARDITGRPIDTWGDLSTDLRIAEFCNFKSIEDLLRVTQDAVGWGEKFISIYFEQLASIYNTQITSMNPSKDGVIIGLIIASNVEKFTDAILEGDFGFPSSPILASARDAKRAS